VLPTERQNKTIEKAVIGKLFATAGKREHNENAPYLVLIPSEATFAEYES
jgi:hypothetical protein